MFSSALTRRVVLSVGALALIGAGCGGPEAKTPHALKVSNPFPTKDALDKLAHAPAKPIPARTVVSVPSFRVDVRDVPETSPAETRFAEIAGDLHFTREHRCVARELGRLRAEHGADADERVQRFIVGACGLTSPGGVSTFHSTAEVPVEATDEQVFNVWKGKLTVPPSFKGQLAGAWLTRKGKQAILMLVAGQPEGAVKLAPADARGLVTVQGTTSADADYVLGLVNQGRDGVARCEPDRSVVLPQFALNCTMREGNPWAWIEVATRTSGRLLMRSTALLLARRDPQAPVELAPGMASSSSQARSPTEITAAVLDGVNQARQSAKLGAVTLASQQTSVSTRLASHFFNAEATSDGRTSDLVALGLLAGWDVEGTIRKGDFFGTILTGAKEPSSWLDYALEHPMGRFTLLQPEARQIAIGAAPAESIGGLGVVITTYSFFGAEDHQADATRVMERLAQERAARRLPPATTLGAMPTLVDEARLVNAGKREPMAALDHALGAESQRIGQSMRGWVLVTNDLDVLPFPNELLAPGPLALRVVVTHYRPENAAWGAYLIYFVAPAPAQQQVASVHPLHASLGPIGAKPVSRAE